MLGQPNRAAFDNFGAYPGTGMVRGAVPSKIFFANDPHYICGINYVAGTSTILQAIDGRSNQPMTLNNLTYRYAGSKMWPFSHAVYGLGGNPSNDYADVSDHANFSFGTGEWTRAIWANIVTTYGGWWEGCIVGHDDGGGFNEKWIWTFNGNSLFYHANGPTSGARNITAPNSLTSVAYYRNILVLYVIYRRGNNIGFIAIPAQPRRIDSVWKWHFGEASYGAGSDPNPTTAIKIGKGEGNGCTQMYHSDFWMMSRYVDMREIVEYYNFCMTGLPERLVTPYLCLTEGISSVGSHIIGSSVIGSKIIGGMN